MAEKKRPELTEIISKTEFLRIIECPVCNEVPFPPIYQCITGHDICNLCKPKLQNCPLCKSRFGDGRNYSLEKMLLAATHSCANKDEGCEVEGPGEVLGDHIKICQYRSFMCPGDGRKINCALSIELSQAREHFLAAHKAVKDSKTIEPLPFAFLVEDHSKLKGDTSWSPTLTEFDGKTFLAQLYTRNDIFYWTFFCVGTAEEAGNYNVEIIFKSNKKKRAKLQWSVPVQPIIKCEELRNGNEMKDALIPFCSFTDFKKVAVCDDGVSTYTFQTEYRISKCEESFSSSTSE